MKSIYLSIFSISIFKLNFIIPNYIDLILATQMFCNTIPILITVISISSSSWLPKIIWTYWDAPI